MVQIGCVAICNVQQLHELEIVVNILKIENNPKDYEFVVNAQECIKRYYYDELYSRKNS